MAEHTVLVDFDPWSEVSHHAHLAHQHARAIETKLEGQSREIKHSISAQTRDLVGSSERLIEKGFAPLQATQAQIARTLAQLPESFDKLELAIQQGQGVIASAIAWGYGRLSKDIGVLKSEVNARLDTLIELKKKESQNWAYEQFEIARKNFKKGLYEEARDRVELAIGGSPPAQLGYKEEFWFHYLLGNIHLGSWAGDKPNIDPKVVDAILAEKAFLSAARYAETEADRSEAFLCAGRSAFVQRELRRAISHTDQAVAGSRRPADVNYQLAKYHAGLADAVGRDDAGQHLRTALLLNLDLLFEVWIEEAYFNRVGALEVALLPAAQEFRTKVRTEKDNYRLAGCFASFRSGRSEAVHHLRVAVDKKIDIVRDALTDEARLNQNGILDEVLRSKALELRGKAEREIGHFERALRFISTVEHAGYSPRGLLNDELLTLEQAVTAARKDTDKGGVWDLDAAITTLKEPRARLDAFKASFLDRLEHTLREKWRTSKEHKKFEEAKSDADGKPRSFSWPQLSFDGWPSSEWWVLYLLFYFVWLPAVAINIGFYLIRLLIATFKYNSWQASVREAEKRLAARQAATNSLWAKSQAIIDRAKSTDWSW